MNRVVHARCDYKSVSIAFRQNTSQNCLLELVKLTRTLCYHQKSSAIISIFTRTFSELFAHGNLKCHWSSTCSLLTKQRKHTIPTKRYAELLLSLVEHFVVINRQRKLVCSTQEAFHDFSHIRICCCIGVQHALCEKNQRKNLIRTKR